MHNKFTIGKTDSSSFGITKELLRFAESFSDFILKRFPTDSFLYGDVIYPFYVLFYPVALCSLG